MSESLFTFEVLIFIAFILGLYIIGLCYCTYINFTFKPNEELEDEGEENEKSSS